MTKRADVWVLALALSVVGFAQDSESLLYVPKEKIEAYWVADKIFPPENPRKSLQKGAQGCVSIGFVINSDGSTSDHRAVAAFRSENFNDSAIRAARKLQYLPSGANSDHESVYTTHPFTFQLQSGDTSDVDEERRQALAELCTKAANLALIQVE